MQCPWGDQVSGRADAFHGALVHGGGEAGGPAHLDGELVEFRGPDLLGEKQRLFCRASASWRHSPTGNSISRRGPGQRSEVITGELTTAITCHSSGNDRARRLKPPGQASHLY